MVAALGYLGAQGTKLVLSGAVCRAIEPLPGGSGALPTLTTIEEVRQLKPEEASRRYPVRVRGVVTLAESSRWGSIHDGRHGINVLNLNSGNLQPAEVGELCEIEGKRVRPDSVP